MGKASKGLIMDMKDIEYYTITIIVYVAVFSVAYYIQDLGSVMSFLGTSTAILLSYILPAGFYLKLSKDDSVWYLKAISILLVTVGVIFYIMCTYHFILKEILPKLI